MVNVFSPRPRSIYGKRRRLVQATFVIAIATILILFSQDDSNHLMSLMGNDPRHPLSLASASEIKTASIGKERHYHVCGDKCNQTSDSKKYGSAWKILCNGELLMASERLLAQGLHVHLVQIGAHVGFEENDPFASGILSYLNTLTLEERRKFHWHFVEPSPPNYKRLMQNLANHSELCDMRGINKAVVPDDYNSTQIEALTFYSISQDIDPETGYDSRSGKFLPPFITQISSFSKTPLDFNKKAFKRKKLDIEDYIVKTKVPTISYSELIGEIMGDAAQQLVTSPQSTSSSVASWFTQSIRGASTTDKSLYEPPLLVLIDTEGLDCRILCGMSETSPFWPPFLIYEQIQCGKEMKLKTRLHLTKLGYTVKKIPKGQNTVAIRNSTYLKDFYWQSLHRKHTERIQ